MSDPRAGQPAQPSDSIDVGEARRGLLHAAARPGRPGAAGRSSAPPATAARASTPPSTRTTSSPPPRPSASTGRRRATTGRCSSAATPTRCPSRRGPPALEVLAANDVTVLHRRRRRLHARPRRCRHAILQANRGQARAGWPTASSSRPRTTRRATAASSTTRPTAARPTPTPPAWIADRANELLRAGLDGVRRIPLRPRPGRRRDAATTSSAATSTTCRTCSTSTPSGTPGCASAPTRWAAPASTTGARSPSGTAST